MGSPSGSAPGTFKYEVEFVSDDEDDARDDDDVVRAEIHFHDVLTEEYASYGVKLPVPWLRKATAKDLVDAFADEYARTRPERDTNRYVASPGCFGHWYKREQSSSNQIRCQNDHLKLWRQAPSNWSCNWR